MRPSACLGGLRLRLLKVILVHVAAFGFAAVVSSSCGVNYPDTAFHCDPSGPKPNCPDAYICCSDDATAWNRSTVGASAIPDYSLNPDNKQVPMFSGAYNSLSTSGMCVREGAVPLGAGLRQPAALGCPVPCNPTWGAGEIEDVCGGTSYLCCQTAELDPSDCVFDEGKQCYRPVTGLDVIPASSSDATLSDWATSAHATHQGPNGNSCKSFLGAEGLPTDGAEWKACVQKLTVADQHGFCLLRGPQLFECPSKSAVYVDACQQLNLSMGYNDC